MADNTTLNTGTGGDVIATDDIAGVKHQRVKLEIGADGAASDVHAGNPLPVSDAGGSLTVDSAQLPAALVGGRLDVVVGAALPAGANNIGAVDTELPAAAALADNIANPTVPGVGAFGMVWDGSTWDRDRKQAVQEDQPLTADPFGLPLVYRRVDTLASMVTADFDAVIAACNQTGAAYTEVVSGTTKISDATNGLDVDVTRLPALPAGTNNIGDVDVLSLPALPEGTNNIGDVDVLSLPALAAGSALIGGVNIRDAAGDSCMDETNNALRVNIIAGAGSGGTAMTDDQPFTVETTAFTPTGGVFRATRDQVGDGDGGAFAMTGSRALYAALETPDGNSAMDDTNDAVRVNVVAGAAAGGTSMVDDAAFTPGTTPITPMGGTYRSTRDALDDNDAGAVALTATRAIYATLETPAGSSMADESNTALRVTVQNNVFLGLSGGGDTITADEDAATISLTNSLCTLGIRVSGTWVATLQFEGQINGGDWFAVEALPASGGSSIVTSTTANGMWFVDAAGCSSVRVRASDYTSGTATVSYIQQSQARVARAVTVGAALPAGTNNIGDVDVLSVVPGVGATELGKAEDAVAGSGDTGVAVLAVRRDSASSGVGADGDYAMLSVTSDGSLRVSGGGGGTQFAEDAAHVSADVGTLALAVRRDTVAVGSGTDGDYSTLNVNASGRLYASATIDAALPAGTNNIGDVDVLSLPALPAGSNNIGDVDVLSLPALPAGSNNIGDVDVLTLPGVTGAAAHDAAVSGNPLLSGFEARTTAPTAVGNGDAVRGQSDSLGKQVTLMGAPHELDVQGDAVFTNTTAADLIAAQGAGIKIVVTSILVVNGHATMGTKVEIRDGTTVLQQGFAAPLGGGWSMSNPRGILKSAANAAITGRCVTTGADVDIFVSGYTITNG